jgi:hypothetical protein
MSCVSWYQTLASSWGEFSSVFMTGGRCRSWHGHVPNEEVSYNEHSVQNMIVEDLQKLIAELTQRLAVQNIEMYRDIYGCDLESNFENPYHNLVYSMVRMKSFNMKKTLKIIPTVL